MKFSDLFEQLQKRRVIRATLIYIALLWVALQAADLFANAGIISDAAVRWTILIGVVLIPVVIAGSWFLEAPWKDRRWTSIVGDVVLIVAIMAATILFVWQQWFTSFVRPVVAVLAIEATDTRDDTQLLADHLSERFRMLLATRAEIRVLDLHSSLHVALDEHSTKDRAAILGADYLLSGSLSRGGEALRLTMQLLDKEGGLIWSDVYTERLIDLSELQVSVVSSLSGQLPLMEASSNDLQQVIDACDYPADSSAIMAVAGAAEFEEHLQANTDNGMLYLAQARQLFAATSKAAAHRKPVLQSLAMQNLSGAALACPELTTVELLRIVNTRERITDLSVLSAYPNEAELYRRAAADLPEQRDVLLREAYALDPAHRETLCYFAGQQSHAPVATFAPSGCDD